MNEVAANLVDHVLPVGVGIRHWVLTLPFPLRFPLAFDRRLLGAVHQLSTQVHQTFARNSFRLPPPSKPARLGPHGSRHDPD